MGEVFCVMCIQQSDSESTVHSPATPRYSKYKKDDLPSTYFGLSLNNFPYIKLNKPSFDGFTVSEWLKGHVNNFTGAFLHIASLVIDWR